MNQSGSNNINYNKAEAVNPSAPKKSGSTRIGVLQPVADEAMDMVTLQKHLVINLNGNNIEAIAVNDAEEAKKYKCDLLLNTNFTKLKQASKVGSLIKAIKNTDPTATTSFNVEAVLSLTKLTDGSKHSEEKVSGKFDGKSEEAAKKAIEKGSTELLSSLE